MHDKQVTASQETGSAQTRNSFPRGKRIMAHLTFLLFLFVSPADVVTGTISDPSGAAITGARVEITGQNFSQTAVSQDGGLFTIEAVPAGTYSLRVASGGFSVYTSRIEVPSDAHAVTLRVAPQTEDVIVTTTRVETPLNMLGVSA